MKTTIYNVIFSSFTESDQYLQGEVKQFTNPQSAQDYFEDLCKKAYDECEWADGCDTPEDDREKEGWANYDVTESLKGNTKDCHATYTASSNAYEGYHAEVRLEQVEIDVPQAMTLSNNQEELLVSALDSHITYAELMMANSGISKDEREAWEAVADQAESLKREIRNLE